MANIYDQHRTAFKDVSAHVVLLNGNRVATIAFKYPRDGAGRLYAYVHWLGTEMVRGHAAGGGYDKHSAACVHASEKMPDQAPSHAATKYEDFKSAIGFDCGTNWGRRLEDAGFVVVQAV